MGYAVQVDPDVLAAGGRRLTAAAEAVEHLAGRVLGLGAAAGAAAGPGELAAALDDAGREAARVVGQAATVLGALGTGTALAGHDYRLLEEALASRWSARGGPTTSPEGDRARPGGPR